MGCVELGLNSTTRTAVRLNGAQHVSLIDLYCFTYPKKRKIFIHVMKIPNCGQKTARLSTLLCVMVFSAGRDLYRAIPDIT